MIGVGVGADTEGLTTATAALVVGEGDAEGDALGAADPVAAAVGDGVAGSGV